MAESSAKRLSRQMIRKMFYNFRDQLKDVTVINRDSAYDPREQEVTNTEVVVPLKALVTTYSDREVNNVMIKNEDRRMTIRVSDLPAGFIVDSETSMLIDGDDYNVMRVRLKLFGLLWVAQVRKSA